jgi:hypothetical protein
MPRLRSPERHQQRPERRDPDLLSPGRASDYGRIAWLFGSRPGGITAVAFLLKESRVHGERPGGDAQSSWSVRAVSPSVQVERRSVTPGTRKDLGQMQTYLHHFLRSMPKLALLTCCLIHGTDVAHLPDWRADLLIPGRLATRASSLHGGRVVGLNSHCRRKATEPEVHVASQMCELGKASAQPLTLRGIARSAT